MSENRQGVFTRYAPSKTPARLEVIDGGRQQVESSDYAAYGIDKPNNRTARLRIEVNNADRTIYSMAKSYLVEVQYSASKFVALVFTNCVFLLEGENLSEFVEKLDDDEIKSIHCFNPKLHDKLPEGKAVITKMRRISIQEMAESDDDLEE